MQPDGREDWHDDEAPDGPSGWFWLGVVTAAAACLMIAAGLAGVFHG